MKKAELEVASEMVGEAADAVEMILQQGFAAAMNKYNRKKPTEASDEEDGE
jgi:peptidyl-tRNA hydrolase